MTVKFTQQVLNGKVAVDGRYPHDVGQLALLFQVNLIAFSIHHQVKPVSHVPDEGKRVGHTGVIIMGKIAIVL